MMEKAKQTTIAIPIPESMGFISAYKIRNTMIGINNMSKINFPMRDMAPVGMGALVNLRITFGFF